mmetsp:Transcript_87319/g.151960  ORF Transcript_87319/g.151960 Transcript_87319/m.151960 type:complete len:233 (-) Transcript_87319:407-1105(-)
MCRVEEVVDPANAAVCLRLQRWLCGGGFEVGQEVVRVPQLLHRLPLHLPQEPRVAAHLSPEALGHEDAELRWLRQGLAPLPQAVAAPAPVVVHELAGPHKQPPEATLQGAGHVRDGHVRDDGLGSAGAPPTATPGPSRRRRRAVQERAVAGSLLIGDQKVQAADSPPEVRHEEPPRVFIPVPPVLHVLLRLAMALRQAVDEQALHDCGRLDDVQSAQKLQVLIVLGAEDAVS